MKFCGESLITGTNSDPISLGNMSRRAISTDCCSIILLCYYKKLRFRKKELKRRSGRQKRNRNSIPVCSGSTRALTIALSCNIFKLF